MTLNQSQREHEAACETIWCYRVNLTLLGLSASVHVFITSVPCNLGNLNTVWSFVYLQHTERDAQETENAAATENYIVNCTLTDTAIISAAIKSNGHANKHIFFYHKDIVFW